MNRLLMGKKLKIKLVLAVVISLVISISAFVILQVVGETVLDSYLSKSTFVENRQKDALDRFEAFVNNQNVSTGDHEQLSAWISHERYLNLYIFAKDQLIFSSNTEIDPAINEELLTQFVPSKIPITTIHFADQEAQIYLVSFYEYQYYNLILIIGVFIAAIVFIVSFLLMINKKTSYIGRLEQEIKILEGGNLDYSITISGKDELSSLAQSIDEMRKSFVERLGSEERVRMANRELITAISHDLRTPLTILLGYMDIIELNKYKTHEDLLQYIHNSREKAYQIKVLSDKLFEYFTVSSAAEEEVEFEIYEGRALIDQLVDEQLVVLDHIDVQVQTDANHEKFLLEINLVAIRRVFDNIFSNIRKYADPAHPVHIQVSLKQQWVMLEVENKIKRVGKKKDSNEIGLVSCQKMIQQHNGTLTVSQEKDTFSLQIALPVIFNKSAQTMYDNITLDPQ
ncbi:HAMP domain-containing sensor histidine kinase [Paenibacillus sp. QZ-Y1]|uniref:sensor histidine kinase n=1 Tax=Paenibacillus sp. QZ-Y1 TaxID=3414511 RepID=UPI003F7910CE